MCTLETHSALAAQAVNNESIPSLRLFLLSRLYQFFAFVAERCPCPIPPLVAAISACGEGVWDLGKPLLKEASGGSALEVSPSGAVLTLLQLAVLQVVFLLRITGVNEPHLGLGCCKTGETPA